MKRLSTALLGLLLTMVLAAPSQAGGWWSSIGLEDQPVGIGETISLRVSAVMFAPDKAEDAKDGAFFAYLVEDFDQTALEKAMTVSDPGEWWEPSSEPIRVGDVELINWDANLAQARVRLDVPQVREGSYYLMLCDLGCNVALGNLIPSRVSVTANALAAKTARRLEQTKADLLALKRSRSDLRGTRRTLRQALSHDTIQTEAIQVLEQQLAETHEAGSQPWATYAGWFFAGVAIALLFGRRRARSRVDPVIGGIPDDARELTTVP